MQGPNYNLDEYYDSFGDKSMIAATGVNKEVFSELCRLSDIGNNISPVRSK